VLWLEEQLFLDNSGRLIGYVLRVVSARLTALFHGGKHGALQHLLLFAEAFLQNAVSIEDWLPLLLTPFSSVKRINSIRDNHLTHDPPENLFLFLRFRIFCKQGKRPLLASICPIRLETAMYEDFHVTDRWTGEDLHCRWTANIVAIVYRHADAVDIRFDVNGRPVWIAMPLHSMG